MNKLLATSIIILTLLLGGCSASHEETALRLKEAVEALDANRADDARSLAGKLLADTAAMDASQLATLAYVFMRLSEGDENTADAPQALMCYHAAVSRNLANAGSLIPQELPEAVRIEDILNKLDGNLRNPASLDGEPDSCAVDSAQSIMP